MGVCVYVPLVVKVFDDGPRVRRTLLCLFHIDPSFSKSKNLSSFDFQRKFIPSFDTGNMRRTFKEGS